MITPARLAARFLLPALLLAAAPMMAPAEVEIAIKGDGERTISKQMSAQITAIDHETRDVTLEGPLGNTVTLNASDAIERLNEFAVGDLVQVTYTESISGELRAPTEAEMEVPWLELDAAAIADKNLPPAAGVGRIIQAVCTVEGLNRATGAVTLLDPRGLYHVIPDVDPARMEGVNIGDTVIITYSQAIALSLEKLPAA
ncbi:MAG: hypothetical protein AAGI44_10525 [Pseudomonadota bacterium]